MASFYARAWFLIAALVAGLSARAGTDFFETTNGPQEIQGGISEAEQKTLSEDTQNLLKKFKDGRKSSNKDQKSRYSGVLEMHDENYTGVTDHGRTGNKLEGGMDEAAIGKSGMNGAEEHDPGKNNQRGEALEKARMSAGLCEWDEKTHKGYRKVKGEDGKEGKEDCLNPSAVLLDRGAAHGDDKDINQHHRTYELTDKAIKGATVAGAAYAQKTIQDASDYGTSLSDSSLDLSNANAEAVVTSNGQNKQVTSFRVKGGDGVTRTVGVAPSIDALQSEGAWLEEQKKRQVDVGWKSMRAARLAGREQDSDTIGIFADIYGKNGPSDEEKDKTASQKIFELSAWGGNQVCDKNAGSAASFYIEEGKTPECIPPQASPSPQGPTPGTPKEISLAEFTAQYKHTNPQTVDALWKAARQANGKGKKPKDKRDEAQTIADIKNCMGRDVWCYDEIHATRAAQSKFKNDSGKAAKEAQKNTFRQTHGDIGEVYDYTREAIYNRVSKALDGGIDNFEKTMQTVDFNGTSDKKTQSKPYAEMMKQIKDNQTRAKAMQGKTPNKVREQIFTGKANPDDPADEGVLGYVQSTEADQYKDESNVNTGTMNTQRIFGRNVARDGTTLSGAGNPGSPRRQPTPRPPPPPPQDNAGNLDEPVLPQPVGPFQ